MQRSLTRRLWFDQLRDKEIITAIDHREYELDPSMCVIADGKRCHQPLLVSWAGRIPKSTNRDHRPIVMEAAIFTPLSVRRRTR